MIGHAAVLDSLRFLRSDDPGTYPYEFQPITGLFAPPSYFKRGIELL
jgi:hypothetical protein